MTHNQWYETFKTKAAGYPVGACQYAIADCHRTLQMICPDNCEAEAAYSVKLWAEIDAMRDRLAYLHRRNNNEQAHLALVDADAKLRGLPRIS